MDHGWPQWLWNSGSHMAQKKLKDNMAHGKRQWPVQGTNKSTAIWVAAKLWKNSAAIPFFLTALNPLLWPHWVAQGCLALAPFPCKAMKMALAKSLWLSNMGLPCSSTCVNLASKSWLATLSTPITSALGAPWALALQACSGTSDSLCAAALLLRTNPPEHRPRQLSTAESSRGLSPVGFVPSYLTRCMGSKYPFCYLPCFCNLLKASCSMASKLVILEAHSEAWATSSRGAGFGSGSPGSTLGKNKVVCGVASGLCAPKLWLEHEPCVAKAT